MRLVLGFLPWIILAALGERWFVPALALAFAVAAAATIRQIIPNPDDKDPCSPCHCEERSDEAISIRVRIALRDCFAEFILGPRKARTRGLAMTATA
ncbi:MAG TPA: hypothetical protein VE993_08290 [Stellaceae bacterium]|nr:hypothetical protein [Stellaceae bacterium]